MLTNQPKNENTDELRPILPQPKTSMNYSPTEESHRLTNKNILPVSPLPVVRCSRSTAEQTSASTISRKHRRRETEILWGAERETSWFSQASQPTLFPSIANIDSCWRRQERMVAEERIMERKWCKVQEMQYLWQFKNTGDPSVPLLGSPQRTKSTNTGQCSL